MELQRRRYQTKSTQLSATFIFQYCFVLPNHSSDHFHTSQIPMASEATSCSLHVEISYQSRNRRLHDSLTRPTSHITVADFFPSCARTTLLNFPRLTTPLKATCCLTYLALTGLPIYRFARHPSRLTRLKACKPPISIMRRNYSPLAYMQITITTWF